MKIAKIKRTGAAVIAAMAAAAIMFTGCIVDQQSIDSSGSGPGGSGGVDAVSFSLELPALQQVATRAEEGYSDGSFWENEIKLLTLLLCDPGPEGELLAMITPTFTSDDDATNATWTITAEIPIRPEPYDLLFVVNYDCSTLDGNGTLVVGEDTQTTIQERLTYSRILWDENNIIPMFGRLTNQTIADDNYTPTPTSIVELRRILARANVVVADDATTPGLRSKFSLTGIRTYNEAPLGHVVPNEAAMANPSLPSPTQSTDINGPVHNNLGDNVYEARRYFYENDKGVAYNGSNLTAWRKSPCIVIEGEYNGVRGWYRLDFVDGTTPLDIVRDHSYNFLITDVSGSGYPKPEYARDYPSTNISATVVPWTDHAISGPVNSQTYTVTLQNADGTPITDGIADGGKVVASYSRTQPGEPIHLAAVSDKGYQFLGWETLPETNPVTGQPLIADPTANPATLTMPAANVTLTPLFFSPPVRTDVVFAAPGMVGIKKSAFDWLTEQRAGARGSNWIPQASDWNSYTDQDGSHDPLTIRGSSTYAGTWVETNIANEGVEFKNTPYQGLESEPVYTLYFKWGSMVAMIGGGPDPMGGDTWSIDDVVWVNPGFTVTIDGLTNYTAANGYYGGFKQALYDAADYNKSPGNNDFNFGDEVTARANGWGDICEEITGGIWRIPTGLPFATTETYAGVNSTGTTYPFGDYRNNSPSQNWETMRGTYKAVTYWRDASSDTAGTMSDGYTVADHVSTGHVATQGQAVSDNQDLFIPAAGRRNTFGEVSYQGLRGYYWTSSAPYETYGAYLQFLNAELWVSGRISQGNGFSVRCVRP